MPNILIGFLKRAKPNWYAQNSLSAPILTRHKCHFTYAHRLATVNQKFNRLFDIFAENHFQRVVVLVKTWAVNGYNKIKKSLQTGFSTWRIILNLLLIIIFFLVLNYERDKNIIIACLTLSTWYPSVPPPGIFNELPPMPIFSLYFSIKFFTLNSNNPRSQILVKLG